jgi:hypothetical protein
MSDLITIHDKDGKQAVTTTPERVIGELIAYGVLNPVIDLVKALKVMSVARAIDDKGEGYKKATKDYQQAYSAVIDLLNGKVAQQPKNEATAGHKDAKPCKYCGVPVVWLVGGGKSIPVVATNVAVGEKFFNTEKHHPHFYSDCNSNKPKVAAKKPFSSPSGVSKEAQAKLF